MCGKMAASRRELLDAEIEHHAVAAVQLDRVLGDLEDLLGGEHLGHVAERLGVGGLLVDRLGGAAGERAHRLDLGRHVGEPDRHRLVLDQNPAALHVILHVVGGDLEGAHADAEILRRLDDLAGLEIDAGAAERIAFGQQVVLRHPHVLEHQLAVVHEAAAERLVAARDGQPGRVARHQEARRALQHADLRIGVGIDHEQAGVVAVGDELLAAVDDPFAVLLHRAGLHRGFRHVVGQPPVGGAARLGQAMGEQELRVLDDAREPALLQVARRQVAQQHRHLPDLHQLVGQPGIAARDLLGDDREGLRLGRLVELEAAELLRHAERADADLMGAFEDFRRQPLLRHHAPFALPIAADERDHHVVDEVAAALPHHALLFGKPAARRDIEHDLPPWCGSLAHVPAKACPGLDPGGHRFADKNMRRF